MAKKRSREEAEDKNRSKSSLPNPNWQQLKESLNFQQNKRFRSVKSSKGPKSSTAASVDRKSGLQNSQPAILGSLAPLSDDCRLTDVIAIDCEMVGVGANGSRDALARVSLVNASGNVIYDEYVRPLEAVSDFRSKISGIRAHHLKNAKNLWVVQKEVAELIKGHILVGHAIHNDLKVLFLSHSRKDTRDTSLYKPLRSSIGRPRALRDLAREILGAKIQDKEHCSIQDARAAMLIYQKFRKEWEFSLKQRFKGKRKSENKSTPKQ